MKEKEKLLQKLLIILEFKYLLSAESLNPTVIVETKSSDTTRHKVYIQTEKLKAPSCYKYKKDKKIDSRKAIEN